jgi:recombination protein RecA
LRSADLLLQGGGFGVLVFDLGSTLAEFSSRIPLATWFRFRAAAEGSRTAIVVLSQCSCVRSSAELVLRLDRGEVISAGKVLRGARFMVTVERRRFETSSKDISERVCSIRKPPQSERGFSSPSALWSGKATWAGISLEEETPQAAEAS